MKLNKGLGIAIILLQLVDMLVHINTGQLERTRIAASLIMVFWVLRAPNNASANYTGLVSLGIYLALNLFFLWQNGFTNPEAGGALRIALFAFVLLTAALTGAIVWGNTRQTKTS
ncbi:MAG TPA: hypothetical protein PLC52_08710 [Anaerolineales bacterium]|nr:hypothetical protein [Anaerolineales bacterium]HRQ92930.1 hypothetical protein [Anaerolineales bacterium]